jgi:CRP/FNR family transcriptional regulator, cyclic AMP receptor protein
MPNYQEAKGDFIVKKVLTLFGEMGDQDVDWLSRHGELVMVTAGHVLIEKGTAPDHLYFIMEGELEIILHAGNSVQLGPGEVVGELSFIDLRPPSASVSATMDSQVLFIDKPLLDSKLREDTRFASNFYRSLAVFLATRLRQTTANLGYNAAVITDDQEEELTEAELTASHLGGQRFDRLLKEVRSPKS